MAIENKAQKLEKKMSKLALELNELRTEKKKFIAILQNLNITYQQNEIDYEQYSLLWNQHISHQTAEYWVAQYETKEQQLIDEINKLRARKKQEADKNKQVGITLSYAVAVLVMLASIATFSMTPAGTELITGYAGINDSATFISEANITAYFSVAMSANLTNGIEFPLSAPPVIDLNATDNYNGADNSTTMFLAVSEDSNVNVDMCINASDMVNQYSNVLAAGNMTYTYQYNESNYTVPAGPLSSTEMTNTAAKTLTDMVPGTRNYYRFWIDAPEKQLPGLYNNSVEFRTVQAGKSCT